MTVEVHHLSFRSLDKKKINGVLMLGLGVLEKTIKNRQKWLL